MIKLKALIAETDRFQDLVQQHTNIEHWKGSWFKTALRLRQNVFRWNQEGLVSDDAKEQITKNLEEITELLKAAGIQANKVVGGGLGPGDF